jgi:predicted small secreted protein
MDANWGGVYGPGILLVKEMNMRMLSIVAAFALVLTGCNTVHGIGQDIEKGGEVIQKAAK